MPNKNYKQDNWSINLIPTKATYVFLGKWYKPWTWFIRTNKFKLSLNYGWKIEQGYIYQISNIEDDHAKPSS